MIGAKIWGTSRLRSIGLDLAHHHFDLHDLFIDFN
jgi:hypothetical protein